MSKPRFLKVKLGDTVLVGEDEIANDLSFVEGARDWVSPKPFQVANLDSVEIKFVSWWGSETNSV